MHIGFSPTCILNINKIDSNAVYDMINFISMSLLGKQRYLHTLHLETNTIIVMCKFCFIPYSCTKHEHGIWLIHPDIENNLREFITNEKLVYELNTEL